MTVGIFNMNKLIAHSRDFFWFIAEFVLFTALLPIMIPLLILSLGYSLFCPYAYKPEKDSE